MTDPTTNDLMDRIAEQHWRMAHARHLRADAAPAWWPHDAWGGYRQDDVRGVLLHLRVEVATHAGHLDIARELTDGAVRDLTTGTVRRPPRSRTRAHERTTS